MFLEEFPYRVKFYTKGSHRHTSNRHGMARRFTHSLFSYSIPARITSGHTDRGKTSGRIS